MIRRMLQESWTLRVNQEQEELPAAVPGSVYRDLLAAGRMEDPFWRDNQEVALDWMRKNRFTYQCRFTPEKAVLECGEALLRFFGVDTAAEIILNGSPLGHVENMHRTYEFNVTHLLRSGENVLTVELGSPAGRSRKALRKAWFLPGWDAGIWRPVELLGVEEARITDVRVRQRHENGRVELSLGLSARSTADGVEYRAELVDPQGHIVAFPERPMTLTVENPRLWWPRGYGEQPLYTVRVWAQREGRVLDRWEGRTGLRTARLLVEKDQFGEAFVHEINGVKIFAMGAAYLPEDCLLSRVTPARTRRLLEDCAAAHFNCVRVWGGGCYPQDFFYDICDELGLLVWQDFMFAQEAYPLTPSFAREVRAEVEDNVRRVRHHPCVALWCGGSQVEQEGRSARQKADHIRLFEYLIPQALEEVDPDACYWPSSPSSGGGFDDPNGWDRGDMHAVGEDHRESGARYASAFGMESWPCLSTVETFTQPGDRNLSSYVMDRRQPSEESAARMAARLQKRFLWPKDFESALYAGQLLQAQEARRMAEGFRQNRGRCMGALYWHLNDCWPGASCSSIDYTGRWKALHYFARRFYTPVLLSCQEDLMGREGTERGLRFSVANETRAPRHVLVKWALRDQRSQVRREETIALTVPPLSSVWLDPIALPEANPRADFISYELWENGGRTSFATALFVPAKHYSFLAPGLACRVEEDEIVVTARAYAQGVEIQNAGEDLVLDDNYFDMLPGERRVKILRGEPRGLRVRSVYS